MNNETSTCPACGAAFGERVPYPGPAQGRYALHFSEIALCPRCGLGAALPRRPQSELDAFYAAGTYWDEAVGRSAAQMLHERNQCRHRVTRALAALEAVSRLRVLDVGAGHAWTAYWIERLAAGAMDAFDFIEPDEANAGAILARPTPYATSRVRTLAEARTGYHVIFLNHVLEHVAEPLEAVRRIRDLLAPGGVAYVEMPNADQRFKSDVFPHTWFFTLEALRQLAARTGIEERARESFGRMPSRSGMDGVWRAGFRAAAALGLADLAGACDDRIWRYETRDEGIWLRWLVGR
jgi:2-polyprenyl-3-methyl-5-hydroxy-6-metoxy-1,4-benzoquinol methylase